MTRTIHGKARGRCNVSFEWLAAVAVTVIGGVIVSLSVLSYLGMFMEMNHDKIITCAAFGFLFFCMGATASVAFRPSKKRG